MESWNRIIAATFIGIALMQILGNASILLTISIIIIGLSLLYYFQNNFLYIPGTQ
jgi:hypothetical protein